MSKFSNFAKLTVPTARLITGLASLLSLAFVPCSLRAAAIGGPITADGYTFYNFDAPGAGTGAGAGTNVNGIANNGASVGFAIADSGTLSNFVASPKLGVSILNAANTGNGMAFGINSAGDVVGSQNGSAFLLPSGGTPQTLNTPAGTTAAFGINDRGNIVGQYSTGTSSPGFYLANGSANSAITINASSGPNTVNAQGVNNSGTVVGFYVGTDGQDHGLTANIGMAQNGALTATAAADPKIPNVPGEPGATFVFSQILGVNDSGLAVGYYGDSTTSQHGFFYNLSSGAYTFLDDPAEQFSGGVEVTQITGVNNAGDIAGFYSDAAGAFHGFVACPAGSSCPASGSAATPEPGSLLLAGFGLSAVGCRVLGRRRKARVS